IASRSAPRNRGHAPGRSAGCPSERTSLPASTGFAPESAPAVWSVPGKRSVNSKSGPRQSQTTKTDNAASASTAGTTKEHFNQEGFIIREPQEYQKQNCRSKLFRLASS